MTATGYDDYQGLSVAIEAGVASVTIDNGPVNLFDRVLYADMMRLGPQLAADDRVRVVVFQSANPDFFIAHFDVSLILRIPGDLPASTEPSGFQQMCEVYRTMPKATIVKLEGRVGGGGSEFSMSCDMRFAAIGRAVLNQPEVALGVLELGHARHGAVGVHDLAVHPMVRPEIRGRTEEGGMGQGSHHVRGEDERDYCGRNP